MPNSFFDTNAIVKYYHSESGSDYVTSLLLAPSNVIFISDLSIIESISTFAKKVRTVEISSDIFKKIQQKLLGDIKSDTFIVEKLTRHHNLIAINLLNDYATKFSLRTLDALQLAAAKALSLRAYDLFFVGSDKKLIPVIEKENFKFINPEEFEKR